MALRVVWTWIVPGSAYTANMDTHRAQSAACLIRRNALWQGVVMNTLSRLFKTVVLLAGLAIINPAYAEPPTKATNAVLKDLLEEVVVEMRSKYPRMNITAVISGSCATGKGYTDPLRGGRADFDSTLRLAEDLKGGPLTASQLDDYAAIWKEARAKFVAKVNKLYGEGSEAAATVLRTTSLYPPDQIVNGLNTDEAAKSFFKKTGAIPRLDPKETAEGFFGKHNEAFRQNYNFTKGVELYTETSGKNAGKLRWGYANLDNAITSSTPRYTLESCHRTAASALSEARLSLDGGDLVGLRKQLERLRQYTNKGKSMLGALPEADYLDDMIAELKQIEAVKKAGGKAVLSEGMRKQVEAAMKKKATEARMIEVGARMVRMKDFRGANMVAKNLSKPANAVLAKAQSALREAFEEMSTDVIGATVTGIFLAWDVVASMRDAYRGDLEGAYSNAFQAALGNAVMESYGWKFSLALVPVQIVTSFVLEYTKAMGYQAVVSREDCEQLFEEGICNAGVVVDGIGPFTSVDAIIERAQPANGEDFAEAIHTSLNKVVEKCTVREFGSFTDAKDKKYKTEPLFNKCLAEMTHKWNRRRMDRLALVTAQANQFYAEMDNQPIRIEQEPFPVVIDKNAPQADLNVKLRVHYDYDDKKVEDVFQALSQELRKLSSSLAGATNEITYSWYLNGALLAEDKVTRVQSAYDLIEPAKLERSLKLDPNGPNHLKFRIVIDTRFHSSITPSGEDIVQLYWDKLGNPSQKIVKEVEIDLGVVNQDEMSAKIIAPDEVYRKNAFTLRLELGDAFRHLDRYYINWYQTKVTDGMGIQATALDTAPPEKADSVTYIARITNIPIETDVAIVNQKGEIVYQMFAGLARGLAAAWGGGKGTATRETRSTPDQFAMLMMARSVSDKMLAGKAKTPEEAEKAAQLVKALKIEAVKFDPKDLIVYAEVKKTLKVSDRPYTEEIEAAYKLKDWKKLYEIDSQAKRPEDKELLKTKLLDLARLLSDAVQPYLAQMEAAKAAFDNAFKPFEKAKSEERDRLYDESNKLNQRAGQLRSQAYYAKSPEKEALAREAQALIDEASKLSKQAQVVGECLGKTSSRYYTESSRAENDVKYLQRIQEYAKGSKDYYLGVSQGVFTDYAKRVLYLNNPEKPPTVAAYDGYCTNEAAIKAFEAPKPSLRASATKLRTGELAELQFKVDNLRSWKGKITWSGDGLDPEQTKEARWSNTFKADKEGQYTITANFSGDGQDYSDSVTLSVSGGVTGRLYGLGEREYFGATRKLKLMLQTTPGQNLDDDPCIQRYRRSLEEQQALDACLQANRKLPEAKRQNCKVPARFNLNECGVSGINLVGVTGYHILWNSSPNLKFKERETEIDNTEVTIDRMTDNLPVWAELRTKQGGFYETVGRTENHDLEVLAPVFRFKYNPSPAEAVVGQPIQVRIVAEPAVPDELIDYRWVEPVDRKELPEKGVIEIVPRDTAPLKLHVIARVPHYGDIIDDAIKDQFIPGQYSVRIEYLGRKFAGSGGRGGAVEIGQQYVLEANLDDGEAPGLRYAWTTEGAGCTLASGHASRQVTVTRGGPESCLVKVTVSDAQGRVIGQGSYSQDTAAAITRAKKPAAVLAEAKALVEAGKLDEAINSLGDYVAQQPGKDYAELSAYLTRLNEEKTVLMKHLEACKQAIKEGRLANARADLEAARKLHPKYAPITDAGKLMEDTERGRR
jgi:hypothetical protein